MLLFRFFLKSSLNLHPFFRTLSTTWTKLLPVCVAVVRVQHVVGPRDQRRCSSGRLRSQQHLRRRQRQRVRPRRLQSSSCQQVRPGGWPLPLRCRHSHLVRGNTRLDPILLHKHKWAVAHGHPLTFVWYVGVGRFILKESSYPRYLHSAVLLSGTLLVFGGNTHNDTSLSNGAKCFSADFMAYDIGQTLILFMILSQCFFFFILLRVLVAE